VRTAPILFSPVDPHVLYFATQFLYKDDQRRSELDGDQPGFVAEESRDAGVARHLCKRRGKVEHRGVIYAIGLSPLSADVIGRARTMAPCTRRATEARRGGRHAEGADGWSKVTQIDASHFDARTAYISVSRFRVDDLTPLTSERTTGGDLDEDHARPRRECAGERRPEDPKTKGLLFAGTEREVYVSFNDGDDWQDLA